MVTDSVQRRMFSNKLSVLIETCHAAGLADGEEHFIGKIPCVIPDSAAVRVGRDNGCRGNVHNIPESLVTDMAHIHHHSKALRLPDIGSTQVRKSFSRHVGTCKRIAFIPPKGSDPESNLIQILQKFRIKAKTSGTFNSQQCRHFSGSAVSFNFIRRVDKGNQVLIFADLPLNRSKLPLKDHNR